MKPTTQQIVGALPHLRYEIESLLLTPTHDPSIEELVESVHFRRMAAARLLYTFFTRPTSKRDDDDVLCEDFGFLAEPLYGSDPKPLLERFNKDLFHLTYTRLGRTRETKRWPLEKLLPPVEVQCRKFIDYILQTKTISINEGERRCWLKLKRDAACKFPLQQHTSNVAPVHTEAIKISRGA
jgi:hypothetical protein